jgi:hypothetical protein
LARLLGTLGLGSSGCKARGFGSLRFRSRGGDSVGARASHAAALLAHQSGRATSARDHSSSRIRRASVTRTREAQRVRAISLRLIG